MSQITGKAGKYAFAAYDVLQIRKQDPWTGKEGWLDFSTIRTDTEARLAVEIVDTMGRASGFEQAKYRIVRNPGPQVVYGELKLI